MKIRLNKDSFKFSASHFTIFSADNSEALHGHNYYVSLEIKLKHDAVTNGLGIDFNVIKPLIKSICDQLDEKVILAQNSPFIKLAESTHQNKFTQIDCYVNQKYYSFPKDYVELLKLENITCETLANYVLQNFILALKSKNKDEFQKIAYAELAVEETRGQSAIAEAIL